MTPGKKDKKPGQFKAFIIILSIATFVFSLGFLPIIIGFLYIRILIPFNQIWHFFLIPIFLFIGILVTIFYQILFSGLIVHLLNIKYEPGVYNYEYTNRDTLNWLIICNIYTPLRKLMGSFVIGELKYIYYRLLGMKIGENTLVGGTIMDPCLIEFGDNCTMGLFAVIYGHIHDTEHNTMFLDRVKIGNRVVIGAGAYIMPGAVIEDEVKIAAGAVVTKGQVLKKGKIYGGIPAREIIKKK